MKPRIVLAYCGDVETDVAIRWLAQRYDAEVIAMTLDLGQRRDPAGTRERALAAGAARAHVLDVRDEFARDYVLPALRARRANDAPPHVVALALPLIAKKLIDVAAIEHAAAIAHASTSTAIDDAARMLNANIRVIAPARAWKMDREQLAHWARQHGVPVAVAKEAAYKVEDNLWGRKVTWPASADDRLSSDDLRRLVTVRPGHPTSEAYVEISFDGGTPVAVNGVPMPLTELIESVSVIAAQQGVGRIEGIERDADGAVTHMLYEAPAATVLQAAYAHQADATGKVRLKLSAGQHTVLQERETPNLQLPKANSERVGVGSW